MTGSHQGLLDILEVIANMPGSRGAILATGDGAYGDGIHSGLEMTVATDVAKTVRRMVVASTTVGAPLEELVINLGAARMMVRPLDDDTALVILLERDANSGPVREHLIPVLGTLQRMMGGGDQPVASRPPAASALDNPNDDDIAELVGGELGPALRRIESSFVVYVQRLGGTPEQSAQIMREQLREWLLCCNPSPYTLPLLLDGLSQTLNDDPSGRTEFMDEMQQILKDSGVWQGTSG